MVRYFFVSAFTVDMWYCVCIFLIFGMHFFFDYMVFGEYTSLVMCTFVGRGV